MYTSFWKVIIQIFISIADIPTNEGALDYQAEEIINADL